VIVVAVKTITITEDAYKALKNMKEAEESFSKTIIRLTKGSNDIRKCFGTLKLNEKELNSVRERVRKIRKDVSDDAEERVSDVRVG
jgi:predicted CopG family antitoxin